MKGRSIDFSDLRKVVFGGNGGNMKGSSIGSSPTWRLSSGGNGGNSIIKPHILILTDFHLYSIVSIAMPCKGADNGKE